jgi:hypothetical protein
MIDHWKRRYMPMLSYLDIHTFFKAMDDQKALAWSINKWSGLKPEVLREYGLEGTTVLLPHLPSKQEAIHIDYRSCPLCQRAEEKWNSLSKEEQEEIGEGLDYCAVCPIYKVDNRDCMPEYSLYHRTGDPVPMLKLLIQAKEVLLNEALEKSSV